MKCKNCGEKNRPGVKFCENCGEPLEMVVEAQEESLLAHGVICSNCGAENRVGVRFCEECGTPLTVKVSEESKMKLEDLEPCPHCGHLNQVGYVNCEQCGKLMHEAPEQAQEIANKEMPKELAEIDLETPKENEVKVKPESMPLALVVCGNCGYENQPDARFCEECGQPLVKPTEQKPKVHKRNILQCPQCGFENKNKARQCKSCGYSFVAAKRGKRAEKETEQRTPRISEGVIEKIRKFRLPKLTYRTTFWSLIVIGVLIAGFFAINSMIVKLSKNESQQLANSIVYSTYPEFQGVKPFVEHTKEGRQQFSTYSFSTNVTGTIEGGGEVEFTRFVVIRVNRSKGDFEILSGY